MANQHSRRTVLGAAPVAALAAPATAHASGRGSLPAGLRPGGEYDRYVADLAERDVFSGTVLLTHRGRPVLSRSYGMADRRRSIPNGPDTIYSLASVTKVFTGLAIAQLAERGALELNQTLGTYLDGFPPEIANAVTVHQLLLHTSGLGDYLRTEEWQAGKDTWDTPEEVMAGITQIIREAPLVFPPGTTTAYSNSGYHVLGEIVAAVTERSYHDNVREHVFQAARMSSSDFYTKPRWREDPRMAHPYALDAAGQRVEALDGNIGIGFIGTPAGNSHATAGDLSRFMTALRDNELLTPVHTVYLGRKEPGRWTDSRLMPRQLRFGTYGPHALLVNDQWAFGHNGGAPGVGAYVEWFPASDVVSVVLCNYDALVVADIAATARRIVVGGW
ncbi:serine hydrolase domain-containing protein [Actinophytocola sp.]|uniref:serine hydrolase domain-containing protein n=1 Tax=Actinophytocola sp. TaxID=1872138 RepID=UPI002ED6445D